MIIPWQGAGGPFINMLHEHMYKCINSLENEGRNKFVAFWVYMVVILYLIPLVLLVFCYARIGRTLMASMAKQRAMQEGSQK